MRPQRRRALSTIALLFASSFTHAAKPRETALTLTTDLRADGERAKAAQVTLTPLVAFYAHNGEKLGDGLVGALLPDFYAGYLENALIYATEATERLRSGRKAKS